MIVAERDASPSVRIVRLEVEANLVAFSSRLPTNEILAVVLLNGAVSRRLPVSMALIVQLMWRCECLCRLLLVEEIDLSVAALQSVAVVLQLVWLVEFRVGGLLLL